MTDGGPKKWAETSHFRNINVLCMTQTLNKCIYLNDALARCKNPR